MTLRDAIRVCLHATALRLRTRVPRRHRVLSSTLLGCALVIAFSLGRQYELYTFSQFVILEVEEAGAALDLAARRLQAHLEHDRRHMIDRRLLERASQ